MHPSFPPPYVEGAFPYSSPNARVVEHVSHALAPLITQLQQAAEAINNATLAQAQLAVRVTTYEDAMHNLTTLRQQPASLVPASPTDVRVYQFGTQTEPCGVSVDVQTSTSRYVNRVCQTDLDVNGTRLHMLNIDIRAIIKEESSKREDLCARWQAFITWTLMPLHSLQTFHKRWHRRRNRNITQLQHKTLFCEAARRREIRDAEQTCFEALSGARRQLSLVTREFEGLVGDKLHLTASLTRANAELADFEARERSLLADTEGGIRAALKFAVASLVSVGEALKTQSALSNDRVIFDLTRLREISASIYAAFANESTGRERLLATESDEWDHICEANILLLQDLHEIIVDRDMCNAHIAPDEIPQRVRIEREETDEFDFIRDWERGARMPIEEREGKYSLRRSVEEIMRDSDSDDEFPDNDAAVIASLAHAAPQPPQHVDPPEPQPTESAPVKKVVPIEDFRPDTEPRKVDSASAVIGEADYARGARGLHRLRGGHQNYRGSSLPSSPDDVDETRVFEGTGLIDGWTFRPMLSMWHPHMPCVCAETIGKAFRQGNAWLNERSNSFTGSVFCCWVTVPRTLLGLSNAAFLGVLNYILRALTAQGLSGKTFVSRVMFRDVVNSRAMVKACTHANPDRVLEELHIFLTSREKVRFMFSWSEAGHTVTYVTLIQDEKAKPMLTFTQESQSPASIVVSEFMYDSFAFDMFSMWARCRAEGQTIPPMSSSEVVNASYLFKWFQPQVVPVLLTLMEGWVDLVNCYWGPALFIQVLGHSSAHDLRGIRLRVRIFNRLSEFSEQFLYDKWIKACPTRAIIPGLFNDQMKPRLSEDSLAACVFRFGRVGIVDGDDAAAGTSCVEERGL